MKAHQNIINELMLLDDGEGAEGTVPGASLFTNESKLSPISMRFKVRAAPCPCLLRWSVPSLVWSVGSCCALMLVSVGAAVLFCFLLCSGAMPALHSLYLSSPTHCPLHSSVSFPFRCALHIHPPCSPSPVLLLPLPTPGDGPSLQCSGQDHSVGCICGVQWAWWGWEGGARVACFAPPPPWLRTCGCCPTQAPHPRFSPCGLWLQGWQRAEASGSHRSQRQRCVQRDRSATWVRPARSQ
jgi:hypothetical protein